MGNIFPCLILYHKWYVQDQPHTEELQIPRVQVQSHAVKIVNPVYLFILSLGKSLGFFPILLLHLKKIIVNKMSLDHTKLM